MNEPLNWIWQHPDWPHFLWQKAVCRNCREAGAVRGMR
ncbi:DUF4172 domain-containing protein [Pseudomonas capsici]|nr:DUF4172 domain-containing protein [Pseudomonas capsici]MCV4343575.1 DUF4172 domain-containing protein [Pseudomonas capsici]